MIDHRDLIKILLAEGYEARKHRGTDQAYKRVSPGGSRTVTVPTHRRQIPRGTMRSILRQAGWTVDHFLMLMDQHL